MKKLYIFLILLAATLQAKTQNINFVDAIKIGNQGLNLGFHISVKDALYLSSESMDDIDIGISAPLLISMGMPQIEGALWGKFDKGITQTYCAGSMCPSLDLYVLSADVNDSGQTLLSGQYRGTLTVNGTPYNCTGGGKCGFIATIDKNCQVMDFTKLEGTGIISVPISKWAGYEILAGVNYSGDFTSWGHTFTSAGSVDAAIIKAAGPSSPTADFGIISGTGAESAKTIGYDKSTQSLIAIVTENAFSSAPAIYSDSAGNNSPLVLSPQSGTSWYLSLSPALDLTSTLVTGTDSSEYEFRQTVIEGTNVYSFGTLYGTHYPDPSNQSVSMQSNGDSKMAMVKYTGFPNLAYGKSFTTQPPYKGLMNHGITRKLIFSSTPYIVSSGQQELINKAPGDPDNNAITEHGLLYIHDTNLVVIDSMLLTGAPGGNGFSQIHSADVDSLGNLYITGYFNDTIDFDPSSSTFNLVGSGAYGDIFIAKYNLLPPLTINENENVISLSIYPNPSNDLVKIKLKLNEPENVKLSISDMQGKIVSSQQFSERNYVDAIWDVSETAGGIYFLKMETEKMRVVKKVVVF